MKILVSAFPFHDEGLLKLKEDFPEVDFVFTKTKDALNEEIESADSAIAFNLTYEQIERAQKLKWIQSLSAGVDAYPLKLIESKGIMLTTGRGIHKIHMSEYAISMMIMAARRLDLMILNQNKRSWHRDIEQKEIFGKKLGIIGLGSIGQEVAKRASILGMEVYGVKNSVEVIEGVTQVFTMEDIDFIAKNCDYIINLLPHTETTNKIIGSSFFDQMKASAVMINMGRGGTVNEQELLSALLEKKFALYISDVFEKEPLPEESPLWKLENIIITPHICGPNENYIDKAYEIANKNIRHYIQGEKLENVYSFIKGY
jgi:D-2-hydroxyacid dehydrogenase (NADP+)